MKVHVYFMLVLLVIPVQASLLNPLSLFGVRPDIILVFLYIIGLLTGPVEGAVAGMGLGLLQDISSAAPLGFCGVTRGAFGLCAGMLGRQVLDIASPANIVFLSVFCLLEGIAVSIFMQTVYGSGPYVSGLFTGTLPRAIYTGLFGTLVLQFIKDRNFASKLLRRSLQKE